jgi:hypothetical protein
MSKKINVNATNSKVIGGKLFITGLKMSKLSNQLSQFIVSGSKVQHPVLGTMYEFNGPFSRA